MIQLKNFVTDIKEIDPVWAFSHYCNIPVDYFNKATIKIKSIFKPDEKTPSFCIYFKENRENPSTGEYKFKCFSTSLSGDHINLVQYKFDLDFSKSCFKIINDYTKWVLEGKTHIRNMVMPVKFKVTEHTIRQNWNVNDKNFFLPFDIGISRLEWGLVKPLEQYVMSNGTREITISGEYLYGYFTRTGELYKIYQPKNQDCKFITVNNDYEVGSEHQENNRYFAILSSWKDALSFRGLNLAVDIKVPPSENTYFSEKQIKSFKRKYKAGFSLLDADDTGLKAMNHYKDNYGIPSVWLPLSKDFSDSIRDHGKNKMRNTVVPLIHKALNN